jgi:saccharopine dehydrogenase (NAD+, L-lysine forming)
VVPCSVGLAIYAHGTSQIAATNDSSWIDARRPRVNAASSRGDAPQRPSCEKGQLGLTAKVRSRYVYERSFVWEMKMRQSQVIVVGAGGTQARAMLEAAARGDVGDSWLALDREWQPETRSELAALGLDIEFESIDVLSEPERFRETIRSAALVANFAGPYYLTGGAVLDACIEVGADYLDICDDVDATAALLECDVQAKAHGIRALIGMGSSPGVTNILVRLAVDALGEADNVDIAWMVDVEDCGGAALKHFWHIFAAVDDAGEIGVVPAWEDLQRRTVVFPKPLGGKVVLKLSHPEPLTIPRFLPVRSVENWGGVSPEDALITNWALARLGAALDRTVELRGESLTTAELGTALFESHRKHDPRPAYQGSGLVIEVRRGDEGFRFGSGDQLTMEESTGTPAAAGIGLMLEGATMPEAGVLAPECLVPSEFFVTLGRVSRSRGSLTVHRLRGGEPAEQVRIRDMAAAAPKPTVVGGEA